MRVEEQRTSGFAAVCFGVIALIASFSADLVGIGDGKAFGIEQIAGIILGLIVIIVGMYLVLED